MCSITPSIYVSITPANSKILTPASRRARALPYRAAKRRLGYGRARPKNGQKFEISEIVSKCSDVFVMMFSVHQNVRNRSYA